ncbi:hypothetical protein DPMN_051037 [Dreissena polymorpha]|uniref:Uncharacterized protein n=1 Tax=Dreissena polymorpha TaxID=45954 RepID=A0A9D4HLT5_DREPO|nr:hypothetical protein DPMN_051037 [Dreissena polymorpha]
MRRRMMINILDIPNFGNKFIQFRRMRESTRHNGLHLCPTSVVVRSINAALPPSPCSLLSKTMHGQISIQKANLRLHEGSCPVVDQDNRTLTDINRIRTGDVMHEFRTNSKLTYEDCTHNGGLCPFYPLENFEHAQNVPTERNGYHRTSPNKERIHRI